MATYLLTWNPERYDWADFESLVEEVARLGAARFDWSCGNSTRPVAGDRAFLLRQGPRNRGLIGSGEVLGAPYPYRHWTDKKAAHKGRRTMLVPFKWDVLRVDPVIPRSALDRRPFLGGNWNTRMSGIAIEPGIAATLERAWAGLTGLLPVTPLPEE